MEGTVYLLHFLEPIGNPANPRAMAQHYIGLDLTGRRIEVQTAGQGAAIVRHVQAQGPRHRVPGRGHLAWHQDAGAAAEEPQARLALLPDLPQGQGEVMPTTPSSTP